MTEIEAEQERVSLLYGRLDALRAAAADRLRAVLRESGGTPQARSERDATVARLTGQLARYDAAEQGLCFGRLDLRDGTRRYLGRVGLFAADDAEPLLVDWRAPAARPFYVATAAAPGDVARRRHIVTRDRRVVALDDEVLDAAGAGGPLTGRAALLAAVDAGRTGHMHDVVATLQAEQDAVIRSDHTGVLVVQGGPGTGKTAVALHRAAYLLYTRPVVASGGVLVVGPGAVFLTYIGQVLPGLGETNVRLATVPELFDGAAADRREPAAVAELKGRAVMADVLAAAVRDRRIPGGAELIVEHAGEILRLDHAACRALADRALATGRPHNLARAGFERLVVARLARLVADATRALADRLEAEIAADLPADLDRSVQADLAKFSLVPGEAVAVVDDTDEAELARVLGADPGVRAALDALWPALTPQRLLADLFAGPARLATAAPELTAAERAALYREPGGGWTPADVPLLDEAAELLGVDDRADRARAAAERAAQVEYARGVLDLVGADGGVDAALLAERQRAAVRRGAANADRTWAFGHLIVDEAQELSRMAWRMLMRRCPSRSMTVVGDVAQTGDPAGTTSWADVLHPFVGDRWRLRRLSVNYRTPAEIMAVAAGVVPGGEVPRSVRSTGVPPWRLAAPAAALPEVLARVVAEQVAALGDGRLAVIVPDARVAELGAAVPAASYGVAPDLVAPVVVLGVRQCKGLEFDVVLIVDPRGVLAGSARGRNDLYVALTRATQRMGIIHSGRIPKELATVDLRASVHVTRR